nr:MAG TPA: hypothetical protein [Caudoviricetes sp.]
MAAAYVAAFFYSLRALSCSITSIQRHSSLSVCLCQ